MDFFQAALILLFSFPFFSINLNDTNICIIFIQNNLLRKKNLYSLPHDKYKVYYFRQLHKNKNHEKLLKKSPKTTKTLYIFYKSLFKYFLNKNKYSKLKIRLLKKLLFTVKRNFISFGLKAILNRFKRLSLWS